MGAGTHAEIYVVNKYLKEKEYTPGSQMRADLVIANLHGRVTPRSPDELVELREFAMCPHCATILNSTLLSQHNITHCHGEKPPAQTKRQQPAPSYSGQKRMHETGGNRARSMEGGRRRAQSRRPAPVARKRSLRPRGRRAVSPTEHHENGGKNAARHSVRQKAFPPRAFPRKGKLLHSSGVVGKTRRIQDRTRRIPTCLATARPTPLTLLRSWTF